MAKELCPGCEGSGKIGRRVHQQCQGSGELAVTLNPNKVKDPGVYLGPVKERCHVCQGSGGDGRRHCSACKGSGQHTPSVPSTVPAPKAKKAPKPKGSK